MNKKRYMKITILVLTLGALFGPLTDRCLAQGSDRPMVRSEIDRTDEVINEVREVVTLSRSVRARDVLNVAVKLQKIAKEMFGSDRALAALKYTRDAREKAQQALAITRQADENQDILRRRMERADDLLGEVRENMPPDAPQQVRSLFEAALKQQQRAREFYHNHQYKAALELSLQVEKTLRKILEMSGTHLRARERYEQLTARYERLYEAALAAETANQERTRVNLEQAARLRENAEMHYTERRFVAAESTIKRAVELLTGIVAADSQKDRLGKVFEYQQRRLAELREVAAEMRNDRAAKALEAAARHMDRAAEMYAQPDFAGTAAQLAAARNQMDLAEELLRK